MANMRFRFRKSFTIIPGILKWTVSKKGTSLNLNLGIFSKTWGTRGNTTTLDMPGTSGMFWRKEEKRKKGKKTRDTDHTDALDRPAGLGVFFVSMLLQLAVYYIWAKLDCPSDLAHDLAFILGIQIILYTAIRIFTRLGKTSNAALIFLLGVVGIFMARYVIGC